MFTPKQLIAIAALLVFLVVSAFFMVNVSLPAWSHWLSGFNVVLFAIPSFWATRRWLGWRDAVVLWLLLGVYALLIETSAIYTGLPYGHFGYSELLGAKIFGATPWTVFLAWTPLIIGAYGVANRVSNVFVIRVVLAAVIATCFDLVLDPGAVKLGFWQYAGNGGFYGVPLSNFGGWLITCSLGAVVIELIWRMRPLLTAPVQITSSAFLILFFWTSIDVFGGLLWPALIGIALLAAFSFYWVKFHYRFDDMLVYVDVNGKPLATAAKPLVHDGDTKLHLAFSIFMFNSKGELLLQRRAVSKKTWPGVWSNSCCGHVMLYETTENAAKRRLRYELGIGGVKLQCILPEYRYRAEKDGIVENEICPVFVGFADEIPVPRPDEVGEVAWVQWTDLLNSIDREDSEMSPWAIEEAKLLAENAEFQRLMSVNIDL